jgi:putative transposase
MLTFQFRLYPSKSQQEKLWKHANELNKLYNYFLNQRIENYKNNIKIGQKEQQSELIQLKSENIILNEIYSQVLQQVSLRIKMTYDNFFRRVKNKKEAPGFPKFRSCKNFFGICYPQSGYKLINNLFVTKQYGKIKFNKHRELKGKIKIISINCKSNKFYLNVTTDHINKNNLTEKIGIDVGLKYLVVTNTGEKIKNCTHAKYFDKQIAKIQSKNSNLKQNSKKYKFIKKTISRLYEAKIRKLNDFQHKVSKKLGSTYDTIYAENLSAKSIVMSCFVSWI